MIIQSAEFTTSAVSVNQCPTLKIPEYAFIGRSNVGKSSLINLLTFRKNMARVSTSPGKTRLINHFLINNSWFLVDLPGYGYAKASKTDRGAWKTFIDEYIKKRENLLCLFILIDSRLEPQRIDIEFINHVGKIGVPIAIVYTKIDKISKNELHKNTEVFKKELLKHWEYMPPAFYTSAFSQTGRDPILSFIEEINKDWVQ